MKNLEGKILTVKEIYRTGMFGDNVVQCCENCGRPIVNFAEVTDGEQDYIIGLDCKKTLIDKPKIAMLKATCALFGEDNAKEYKAGLAITEKFLRYAGSPDEYIISFDGKDVDVHDKQPNKHFPEMVGNLVMTQSQRYLTSLGLTKLLYEIHLRQ